MARNVVVPREIGDMIVAAMEVVAKGGQKPREWVPERIAVSRDTNPRRRGPGPEWWASSHARERQLIALVLLRNTEQNQLTWRIKVEAEYLVYRDGEMCRIYVTATDLGRTNEENSRLLAETGQQQ